jgi:hypothetical protein
VVAFCFCISLGSVGVYIRLVCIVNSGRVRRFAVLRVPTHSVGCEEVLRVNGVTTLIVGGRVL